jgi:hypothetical protein
MIRALNWLAHNLASCLGWKTKTGGTVAPVAVCGIITAMDLAARIEPALPVSPEGATAATNPETATKRPFHLPARLRCARTLNRSCRRKNTSRRTRAAGKGQIKAVQSKAAKKRQPEFFPVKRKAVTPKRATTRIITARPVPRSATIIAFPQASTRRLKKAA